MTAHELGCLEHLKRARTLGTSVAEYARLSYSISPSIFKAPIAKSRGHVLEFASWPPAKVMTAALLGGYDAAA